jgi:hypothetical protein
MRGSAVRAVERLDLDALRRAGPDTVGRFSEVLLEVIGRNALDVDLRIGVAEALLRVGTPDAKAAADEFLRAQHEAAADERELEQERVRALVRQLSAKVLVYSYGSKCDICSRTFEGDNSYEVPNERFQQLVAMGYNPFATGRAQHPGLKIEQAYAGWLSVIAR